MMHRWQRLGATTPQRWIWGSPPLIAFNWVRLGEHSSRHLLCIGPRHLKSRAAWVKVVPGYTARDAVCADDPPPPPPPSLHAREGCTGKKGEGGIYMIIGLRRTTSRFEVVLFSKGSRGCGGLPGCSRGGGKLSFQVRRAEPLVEFCVPYTDCGGSQGEGARLCDRDQAAEALLASRRLPPEGPPPPPSRPHTQTQSTGSLLRPLDFCQMLGSSLEYAALHEWPSNSRSIISG